MAKLLSDRTAEWLQAAMRGPRDLRSRRRITRWTGDESRPLPFTLRVVPEEGDNPEEGEKLLVVYLPWDYDSVYVFRNGTSVPKSQRLEPYGEDMPDWYVIALLGGVSDGSYLVYVQVGPNDSPENPQWPSNQIRNASEWGCFIDSANLLWGHASPEGIAPFGVLEIQTTGESPDEYTAYSVYNISHGPFSFDWVETDEEAAIINGSPAWPRSLTRCDWKRPNAGDYGAMGIYDFYNPTPLSAGASGEQKWADGFGGDMVLVRHYNIVEGRFEVAYISLYEFGKGNAEDHGGTIEDPLPQPDGDCLTVDTDPKHLWVWDSCRQKWVRITVGDTATGGRGLDAHYWIQGGTFANCYGFSIGNSTGAMVIALDLQTLVGDWTVSGNTLTLDGTPAQWQTVNVETPNGTKQIRYLGLPPQNI